MSLRYRMFSFSILSMCFGATILPVTSANAQTPVFINEIHYDNTGLDVGEGVEIAGPAGTDLTGWRVRLYNGSNGTAYDVIVLSGVIPDQCSGHGALWFPEAGLQNGPADGLALVNASAVVLQFLSYEGTVLAVGNEANGMTSTDIGVSESESTPVGHSLQLIGSGPDYEDYSWNTASPASPGLCNPGQPLPVDAATWGAVKAIYR